MLTMVLFAASFYLLEGMILWSILHHHSMVSSAFSVQKKCVHPSRRTTALSFTESKSTADNTSVERIRAAVYQPPIPNDNVVSNPLEILKQVADVLRMASRCSIDIVVFPELFLSGGRNRVVLSESEATQTSIALDRESYELNIVGNLCEELNVACITGYAESMHASEMKSSNSNDDDSGTSSVYNSIAAFHADGSRAGNYRCVNGYPYQSRTNENGVKFLKGHPLVEAMTISIELPSRMEERIQTCREIKVGVMCGDDLLIPEHSRHLARSGAQMLIAGASFQTGQDQDDLSTTMVVEHIVPCRSIENRIPLLFANYVDTTPMALEGTDDEDKVEGNETTCNYSNNHVGVFIGSSAIISQNGSELVRAPREEFGDLPSDSGYLLPCDVGALYAADMDIDAVMISDNKNEDQDSANTTTCHSGDVIQNSVEHWDLTPRINIESTDHASSRISSGTNDKKRSTGFGREVQKIVRRQKQASRKSKKRK